MPRLYLSILAAATLAFPTPRCPSCGQSLTAKNRKRHLAFCAPDLLDPDGWQSTDQSVVLQQVEALHRPKSAERKALMLRFGPEGTASQQEVAESMGWSTRRTRDTISRLLHSIPPVADTDYPLDILHEDAACIAVCKPGGIGVTPDHRWRGGSVLNRVIGHLGLQPGAPIPAPVHRLDMNTSGVLVFAKTQAAASRLMTSFAERQVVKVYAALLPRPPRVAEIDAPLCRVEGALHCERRVCAPGEFGQSAQSTFRVVASSPEKDGPCLVQVRPEQGRTHQVRVHCRAAGAPIISDELYAASSDPPAPEQLARHALHAQKLICAHPTTGQKLTLVAPLPADMLAAAQALGISL